MFSPETPPGELPLLTCLADIRELREPEAWLHAHSSARQVQVGHVKTLAMSLRSGGPEGSRWPGTGNTPKLLAGSMNALHAPAPPEPKLSPLDIKYVHLLLPGAFLTMKFQERQNAARAMCTLRLLLRLCSLGDSGRISRWPQTPPPKVRRQKLAGVQ